MITFKSIQLVGFKSFADKTVIPLDEGVTCIVGPNGCGKSNVADAIRWVLGEQSAKMMRGSNMQDVIFNGTDTRKKMSFCEVTLSFDNTNRIFEVDTDEVEMTRRLYADGESEYLLNKQPSRMRVLTNLFHHAGAAKEGYSIIGQGRIDQIMNAKPEDRRSIFEEATGIVVFKDRKVEAERKLNASQDNLNVFMQRMSEVERQIGPLKKASENAIKYRDLYSELRKNETNLYICRHDGVETEREAINAKVAKVTARIEEVTAESDRLLTSYKEMRDEVNDSDLKLRELNEKLLKFEVGNEHRSGQSKLYSEKANSLKNQIDSATEELNASTNRIEQIERELKTLEAYAEKNGERVKTLNDKAYELNAVIEEMSKKIADYEYVTGEHRQKVMDTFKYLSDIKENIGSLAAQKEFLGERIKEVRDEMEGLYTRRNGLREEYESAIKRANELNEYLGGEDELIAKAEENVRVAADKIQSLIKQEYDTNAQIVSLNDSLDTYRALRDRFEGYVYSVRKLLVDSKTNEELSSRIEGLIADIVRCDSEYETAIETAFGGAMQNIVTRTRSDTQYLVEYLKRNRAGQVTFLPIESMRPILESDQIKVAVKDKGALGLAINFVKFDKKFENIIHHLLGNTLVCDNIQNATEISRRYPRAFKIVTLDGDVINRSGSVTGGSKREVAGNLLANERKIKELEDSISIKKSLLARAASKREELDEQKKQADGELVSLNEKLQSARLELAAASEKQTSLLKSITEAEAEYNADSETLKEFQARLESLDSEYSGVSKGASDLYEQSDKESSAIKDMSAEYDILVSKRSQATEELNSALVEIAALESSQKSGAQSAERLRGERDELAQKKDNLTRAIPSMEDEYQRLLRQAMEAALSKDEQEAVNVLHSEIDKLQAKKEDLNRRIAQDDSERLAVYTEKEKLTKKLSDYALQLQKLDSDLEYLRTRISEEYGEDYEGCLKYKVEDFNPFTAGQTIATLKRQITMLGPINHNAVEEYDELSARYEKMKVERDDLEKGIADLTLALGEIRNEMLTIFDEGFNKINENFKRTFKELFGGGRAELQLDYTDCEDKLNAGVEIIACPPGKKLTKISLLSGGERALTAIAILFAIIGMRPMPFCVLDEIEAALDEANVGRYASYLKKFATDTQFIVITHRKPTMEMADTLFGVTMEEKGVSKIVSVKLSEVQEKLGGDAITD